MPARHSKPSAGPTNRLSTYNLLEKLGEGTYGRVYKAINKYTKEYVALKQVKLDPSEEGIPATTLREISILKQLKHSSLVCLHDCIYEHQLDEMVKLQKEYEARKHNLLPEERQIYEERIAMHMERKIYLVFEYMPSDLKGFLDSQPGKRLSTKILKKFMVQLLQSVGVCHANRILHRDLKPQNFLVDPKTLTLKLCDFGLGREHGLPITKLTHEVVTLWYRPPEILMGMEVYSAAVDMWGVGAIFVEMATGKALFPGDSEIDQLFQIFRILGTPTERVWPGVSKLKDGNVAVMGPKWHKKPMRTIVPELCEAGHDLLASMLQYAPGKRIDAKEALNHRYLAGVHLDSVSG